MTPQQQYLEQEVFELSRSVLGNIGGITCQQDRESHVAALHRLSEHFELQFNTVRGIYNRTIPAGAMGG